MGYHSFSVDPRTILGVGRDASMEEIREAYRAKSKKHHPDAGGDEWAFRMVARAYDVLKTTSAERSRESWGRHSADLGQQTEATDWNRAWGSRFERSGTTSASWGYTGETKSNRDSPTGSGETGQPGTAARAAKSTRRGPDELRMVDVELIWTRFEKGSPAQLVATQEGDDATLSICMVVSWPSHELIDRAADFSSMGETLRALIEAFEHMRAQRCVVASRSRIEDGRFVGWLSYPDVLTAQDAFLAARERLATRRLTVKLYTRDERVPLDWYDLSHQPVMSQTPSATPSR